MSVPIYNTNCLQNIRIITTAQFTFQSILKYLPLIQLPDKTIIINCPIETLQKSIYLLFTENNIPINILHITVIDKIVINILIDISILVYF